MTPAELERFFAKVDKQEGGCWIWTGARVRASRKDGTRTFSAGAGYGLFAVGGRLRRVHRASYEHFAGPIPDGLTVEHACHTADVTCRAGQDCPHRSCVNPAHLELLTRAENTLAGQSKPAANAQKTHCSQGHEFTPENTATPWSNRDKASIRSCRRCARDRARARRLAANPDLKTRKRASKYNYC